MLANVIANVISLLVGIGTGFYFERRSDRSTRVQKVELEERLHALRESVYALGAQPAHPQTASDLLTSGDLVEEVMQWIREFQGPDGSIPRMRVVRRFLDHGCTADQILAALAKLDEGGLIALGEDIRLP